MSIIDAEEWDACYEILKAAVEWRKARERAMQDINAATFSNLAHAELTLLARVTYWEQHYGDDKDPHDRPPA